MWLPSRSGGCQGQLSVACGRPHPPCWWRSPPPRPPPTSPLLPPPTAAACPPPLRSHRRRGGGALNSGGGIRPQPRQVRCLPGCARQRAGGQGSSAACLRFRSAPVAGAARERQLQPHLAGSACSTPTASRLQLASMPATVFTGTSTRLDPSHPCFAARRSGWLPLRWSLRMRSWTARGEWVWGSPGLEKCARQTAGMLC